MPRFGVYPVGKVFKMDLQKADKGIKTVVKAEQEQTPIEKAEPFVKVKGACIPEMPEKSVLASKYSRLADSYNKLEKQNTAIYRREQPLANVEKELAGTKGIFKAKQRKGLRERAEQLQAQIASMKAGLQRKCRNGKITDRVTNTRKTTVADKNCCRGDTPLQFYACNY